MSEPPVEEVNRKPRYGADGTTRGRRRWRITAAPVIAALAVTSVGVPPAQAQPPDILVEEAEVRSLDGSGNNPNDSALGTSGQAYPRLAGTNYADGVTAPVDGPEPRYLSNRIFNDSNQNVFSENDVTHWGFVWGQFVGHNIGLRQSSDEAVTVPFNADDPLEDFTNDLGIMQVNRSAAVAGTGVTSPREQVNVVSSYLDGWAVYGGSSERLDWLREGPLDGDPTNNDATLLTENGYLPTAAARSDADAPETELQGRLRANPGAAVIAGDVRVNENIGLTAVQNLFVREHNRIVNELPDHLDEEAKFQIARRVVGATLQYITYNEFLPAVGVDLDRYRGYDDSVDPSIGNEFATVGYRAHSHIHGEFETAIPLGGLDATESEELLASLTEDGVEVEIVDDDAEIAVPLNVGFGNPALVETIGLGNLLAGFSSEAAYKNDEQVDNQLRSVLFQVPGPGVENPLDCLDGEAIAECFTVVNDLAAIDVVRSRDHGMPLYNDMREAYGLPRITSFAELTGETTEDFPVDPLIDDQNPLDDPDILEFTQLLDGDGNELEPGSDAADGETVTAIRRTTTAARLKAIYGSVDAVDAFTGMISEPHVATTEFGELQLAMWETQFEALRDGDRFFYDNDDRVLRTIGRLYGVDYRQTLGEVIAANTDIDVADLPESVFLLDGEGRTNGNSGDRRQDSDRGRGGDNRNDIRPAS